VAVLGVETLDERSTYTIFELKEFR
jgi:hypothetical protein